MRQREISAMAQKLVEKMKPMAMPHDEHEVQLPPVKTEKQP